MSIEGPSKADVQLKDLGHGYTICCYKVSKPGPTPSAQATCTCIIKCACCVPGEYGVHVKYDDEHVPDSPVMVYVAPEAGDAKLCTVHSIRDRGLDVSWVPLAYGNVSKNVTTVHLNFFRSGQQGGDVQRESERGEGRDQGSHRLTERRRPRNFRPRNRQPPVGDPLRAKRKWRPLRLSEGMYCTVNKVAFKLQTLLLNVTSVQRVAHPWLPLPLPRRKSRRRPCARPRIRKGFDRSRLR